MIVAPVILSHRSSAEECCDSEYIALYFCRRSNAAGKHTIFDCHATILPVCLYGLLLPVPATCQLATANSVKLIMRLINVVCEYVPVTLSVASIGVTFPNRLGSLREKRCSRYHQNSDEIGFIFIFDPFSYTHWGPVHHLGAQPNVGGWGSRALSKRYKVTPLGPGSK